MVPVLARTTVALVAPLYYRLWGYLIKDLGFRAVLSITLLRTWLALVKYCKNSLSVG
ncbi:hypothetical protein NIES39_E02180 [Arthrospira platensis NIES-39]|nr:hypothetical protein NIES39_E02180 [Arthrospira platensis NIES-39]